MKNKERISDENNRRRRRPPSKHSYPLGLLIGGLTICFFAMETLFRIYTTGNWITPAVIIGLIFSTSLAIIIYGLIGILDKSKRTWLLGGLFLLLWILYSGQLVYYDIFDTLTTSYSIRHGGQVTEFWNDALLGIARNGIPIMLMLCSVIALVFLAKKVGPEKGLNKRVLVISLIIGLLIHLGGVGIVRLYGQGENSPYNLYYNIHEPRLSVDNLGLFTFMRLDVYRYFSDWSPSFTGELPPYDDEKDPPENGQDEYREEPRSHEPVDDDIVYEPEPPVEYNVLDIDFERLIEEESREEIIEMHEYFHRRPPSEKNEYTGKYEGYNLIVLTAEAFSHLALHEEVTPTLYKMVHEGYHFKNFYTPIWGVSTLDGEYVANTGLIPKSGVWSFRESSKIDLPLVFGNQMSEQGYITKAYHNHTYSYYDRHLSHPNMGYEYKGIGNGLQMTETWPRSDLEMMEVTIPEYIDQEPFHIYYLTISGHLRYTFTGNQMARKNQSVVEHLPYSSNVRAYLATQVELDRAMEYLLDALEEKGIAENTLIVMSSDHYPYGLEHHEIEELEGNSVDRNFELYRNALVIYSPGMEGKTFEEPASSLDIMPTVSNLMGLDFDSRLFMGQDLFAPRDPLVIFQNRSFITDKGRYNASTGNFTADDGVEVEDGYRETISNRVSAKFHFSARILDHDYYSKVMEGLEESDE